MSESEPIVLRPVDTGAKVTKFRSPETFQKPNANRQASSPPICFDRHELNRILNVYGRMVARGEWRDYAIDMLKDRAVFSVFRHSSEFPLYRIEKSPRLARRQGAYSVITPTGHILRRGGDLTQVLHALDKRLRLVEA